MSRKAACANREWNRGTALAGIDEHQCSGNARVFRVMARAPAGPRHDRREPHLRFDTGQRFSQFDAQ
jgi:hypothetical protein